MSVERTKALQVGTSENDFRAEKQSLQRLCRELVARRASSGWVAGPGTGGTARGTLEDKPGGASPGGPSKEVCLVPRGLDFFKNLIMKSLEVHRKLERNGRGGPPRAPLTQPPPGLASWVAMCNVSQKQGERQSGGN